MNKFLHHLSFTVGSFELWADGEFDLYICSVTVNSFHGSLFMVSYDFSGLREGAFDVLYIRGIINYIRDLF